MTLQVGGQLPAGAETILGVLEAHGVDYVVVGGFAATVHGASPAVLAAAALCTSPRARCSSTAAAVSSSSSATASSSAAPVSSPPRTVPARAPATTEQDLPAIPVEVTADPGRVAGHLLLPPGDRAVPKGDNQTGTRPVRTGRYRGRRPPNVHLPLTY